MPATFDSFGMKFMYPDNWVVSPRSPEDAEEGLTLELPGGGFFSVEFDDGELTDEEILQKVNSAIAEEYEEIESEEVPGGELSGDERAVDFRFFYLDLLVVSRVILLGHHGRRMIIQFQAESRDFDANEMVLEAILKQIREQAN